MSIQSLKGPGPGPGDVGGGLSPVARNMESSSAVPAQAAPAQAAAVRQPRQPVQPQPQTQTMPEPSLEDVKKAAQKVQEAVQLTASNLRFFVDEESGKTVVTLSDAETGEIIRQMPSKEMIELSRNIDRLQGMLLKQKA